MTAPLVNKGLPTLKRANPGHPSAWELALGNAAEVDPGGPTYFGSKITTPTPQYRRPDI